MVSCPFTRRGGADAARRGPASLLQHVPARLHGRAFAAYNGIRNAAELAVRGTLDGAGGRQGGQLQIPCGEGTHDPRGRETAGHVEAIEDSLSDFISFGAAPAVVLYLYALAAGTPYQEAKAIVIAAGIGAFSPRRLPQPCAEPWYGKGIHDRVLDPERFRGKRVLIIGGGDSAFDWAHQLLDRASSKLLAGWGKAKQALPDA